MASRGLLQAARQQRAASTMAGRSLPQASRQGALGAARHGATRDISIGRDGRHWNTVLLMVPQAEEWQIERFGKFSHTALPGLSFAIPFVDAYKASYGIEDPEGAITTLAQSAMRKEVGNLELDQLFLEREKLNVGIAQALDEASQPWGIRV